MSQTDTEVDRRNEAVIAGTRALLSERLGPLASAANDKARVDAVYDAATVIDALEDAGLIRWTDPTTT